MTELEIPETRFSLPCDKIIVEDRLRADLGDVQNLADSIRDIGLIQPIVIDREYRLIAGGRRWTAISQVLKRPTIDVVFVDSLSPAHSRIMEIEENVRRKDMTWTERVIGVHEIHRMMEREKHSKHERWTQNETASLLGVSRTTVTQASILAQLIISQDKQIIACTSATEALKLIIKRKEDAYTAQLAKHALSQAAKQSEETKRRPGRPKSVLSDNIDTLQEDPAVTKTKDFGSLLVEETLDETPGGQSPASPAQPTVHTIPIRAMLHQVDCLDFMDNLPDGAVDHVVTDIPYGINMDNLSTYQGIDDVRQEHDVEENMSLYARMFPKLFRVVKDKGFMVFWYDLDHHNLLHQLATDAGFTVQRWPIVWVKTHPCRNGAPQQNFCKNYEHAMVMRKGNATLVKVQPTGYIQASAERDMRMLGHPFVKPESVWRFVYSGVAMPGQVVYDPFAGVGSATIAAAAHGLYPLANEKVEGHYNKLVVNVTAKYEQLLGNVRFE